MTTFNQTQTAAAVCSAGNFCTGNTTTGSTNLLLQASEGGTGGTTNQAFATAASANNADCVFWEIVDGTNNLEDLDGATGDWVFGMNISLASMDSTWTGAAACRVNSSCVNQETICGDQTISISLGSTGNKSSGNINQASTITMGATDLIVAVYAVDNADTMMDATANLDADDTITNQWNPAGMDAAAAQTAPTPSQSAAGGHELQGTAAQTMPTPAQAAAGAEEFTAAAAQQMPVPSQAATGAHGQEHTAAAAQVAPTPSQTATGLHDTVGTAGQAMPVPSQAATGQEAFPGTAAQTAPTPSQTATGAHDAIGAAAQVAPTPSQNATGEHGEGHTGAGAQLAPTPSQTATGSETIPGAAAQAAPTPTQAASGALEPDGVAAQRMAPGAVTDSYTEDNADATLTLVGSPVREAAAQSFTGDGRRLVKAVFYLSKAGNPTGNATARLYAHTGTFGSTSVPTGAPLATSGAIDVTTIGAGPALVEFSFDATVETVNATKYCIAVHHADGDGTNHLVVHYDLGSPSHAGNGSTFNGTTWGALSLGRDVVFYAHGEAPAFSQSAAGVHTITVTGTAAQAAPTPSQAATGAMQPAGAAAQLAPTPSQAASGALEFTAAAAQVAPTPSHAATGAHIQVHAGAGAQLAPTPSQAATGAETLTGLAAQLMPTAFQDATGIVLPDGVAAQLMPTPAQSATGLIPTAGLPGPGSAAGAIDGPAAAGTISP